MSTEHSSAVPGTVASLHLHPPESGAPMIGALFIELAAEQGIVGNKRYFARRNSRTGLPSKRQVTLIEREQISEHAAELGVESIPPGEVRSNIETFGIHLVPLIGREIRIGSAVLYLAEPRTPCPKMDAIFPGLQRLMFNSRQGVIAEVRISGRIAVGDSIECLPEIQGNKA